MDKQYVPSPLCKEGQTSNRDKRKIIFSRYENELIPRGVTAIWIIQEEGGEMGFFSKIITHTPSTLLTISSVFLNLLAKITSRKPNFHYERV